MTRKIITYPSPILRKKSKDILKFDKELHNLLDDMNDTMQTFGGVGLAAIQIGIPLKVLIINIPIDDETSCDNDKQLDENLIEAINPKITHQDGEILFNEGCLSVPTIHKEIKRAMNITVVYKNRYGDEQTMKCDDFLAVAWQHEIEHLNGHLFIENLSFNKRRKFEKEWKAKLKEDRRN